MRYLPEAHRYHRALRALGVTVDMVAPAASLDGYDLVVVPTLYTATDAEVAVIAAAAERGSTILVTPFSGIVDETDAIHPGSYPGAFRDLLGLVIDEFRPLAEAQTVSLRSGAHGSIWSEAIRVRGAEIIDTFS